MTERIRKPRTRVEMNTRTEVIDGDHRTRAAREAEAIKAELDELLDEVDAVLEENAEEFVNGYVQVNGQ